MRLYNAALLPFILIAVVAIGVFGVMVPTLEHVRGVTADSVTRTGIVREAEILVVSSRDEISDCYERAHVAKRGARVVLRLEVAPVGYVTDVHVLESPRDGYTLVQCLTLLARTWEFSRRASEQSVAVEIDPERWGYSEL